MSDLAAFLLARIAEDEARLQKWDEYPSGRVHWPHDCDYPGDEPHGLCTCTLHAQLLAECDAKRRIIELHKSGDAWCDHCRGWYGPDPAASCPTLRLLALPYADDPGYREEWKP